MPRWVVSTLVVLAIASVLPFAWIFRARQSKSPLPRIHLIQGMDNQPRYKGQQANAAYADGRADRRYPAGTIARGRLFDDAFAGGHVEGRWLESFPLPVDDSLLARGRERFNIYCSPCHGLAGDGDGIVSVRADRLQEGTWVPASSLHDRMVAARSVGHLFNTVTHGIRTMPSYGSQISEGDRWAIVSYVRALQVSRSTSVADWSPDRIAKLREVAP